MKKSIVVTMCFVFFLFYRPGSTMALPNWGVGDYVQTYVTGQEGGGGATSATWGELSVTGRTQFPYGGFDLNSEASAQLQGAGISPLLTAYASISGDSVWLDGYYAEASAIGIEYYQFTGSSPVTYHVEAKLSGNEYANGKGQIQYGFLIQKRAFDQNSLNASEDQDPAFLHDYLTTYSTDFPLMPGDFFSVKLYLNALVQSGSGTANARNTFFLEFTEGNLNDLIPQSGQTTPIPEPSTMFLLGSSLLGLAGYGRKRFFKK